MVSSIRPTSNHVQQTGEPVSVHFLPTNVPLPLTPNHVISPGEPVSVHVIPKSPFYVVLFQVLGRLSLEFNMMKDSI